MDIHPIDRKQFITGGSDGCVRLIRRKAVASVGFNLTQQYGGHCDVTGAAFDAQGERIAATVLGGQIHVLQTDGFAGLTAPSEVRELQVEVDTDIHMRNRRVVRHTSESTIKTVNWYGDCVMGGCDEGGVFWFEVHHGTVVNVVRAHNANVNVVTVHKEKLLLATSGIDDFAVLWEPRLMAQKDIGVETMRVDALLDEIEEMNREEEMRCIVM
jgi:hypothetical protein